MENSSGLWYPRPSATNPNVLDPPLEAPIKVPTSEEFRTHFAQGVWNEQANIISLPGSFNALIQPETPPVAFAFLDLDEVVGNLGGSVQLVINPNFPRDSFTHNYGDPKFINHADKISRDALIRLVKQQQQPGVGMQPVAEVETINTLVHIWREMGVYVVFLTSAMQGAELSHVDFIAKYFRGTCDGIVITRNSNGNHGDKGLAAVTVADFAGTTKGMSAIAIDDVGSNTKKIREALQAHPANFRIATFQHHFASNKSTDLESTLAGTPLEAFVGATHFLQAALA